jgi:hypothetical protein
MATNIIQRRSPGSVQPFVTLNPAPVTDANRAPTVFDNYEPSTIWIQPRDVAGNPVNQIWIMSSTQDAVANWIQIAQAGGDATFTNITVTNDATISNDLIVDGNIDLPQTNGAGTSGVILLGTRFISNFGTNTTFVGANAGNTTLTGLNLVGIGTNALNAVTTAIEATAVGSLAGGLLTTGNRSTLIGSKAGQVLTTGQNNTLVGTSSAASLTVGQSNCAVGFGALSSLIDGTGNLALGTQAGIGLTTNDSNNIAIGNNGIPGDNRVIRLGTPGGTHLQTFIAGTVDTELSITSSEGVFSEGDPGSGALATTGFTNVVNTTQGVGTLLVKSTNGNGGDNTGFMKFYVNGVAVFVPYFTNIAP